MNRFKLNLLGFALVLSSSFAHAENMQVIAHPGEVKNDIQIVNAVSSRQSQFYVEGGQLVVTSVLPDDVTGLPHQKWEASLSDGSTVMIVYNSNMGEHIPVELGKTFSVGGQFIWTAQGGLVHWVHADPKHKRPDGYVMFDGVVYGGAQTSSDTPNEAAGF